MTQRALITGVFSVALLLGCSGSGSKPPPMKGVTKDNHTYFPITAGTAHEFGKTLADGTVLNCDSCHPPNAASFTDFTCISCHDHEQPTMDLLHLSQSTYTYASSSCFSCHPKSVKFSYDHFGISSGCAYCHDVGGVFVALDACSLPPDNRCKPSSGDAHVSLGLDCSACHVTTTWLGAGNGPGDAHDPAHDVTVHELLPSWSGSSIASVSPNDETLPQVMNHASSAVDSNLLSACTNCHFDAASGVYLGALFHSTLANLADAGVTQPVTCNDCHKVTVASSTVDFGLSSMPQGFVGPLASNPARSPASGEMRHDAVAWASLAPTTTPLLAQDCAVCHAPPTEDLDSHWTNGRDANPATFHPALTALGQAQPSSCIDCHANSRPTAQLDSSTASLPAGLVFDHQNQVALDDCAGCHTAGGVTQWSGGKFHLAGAAAPTTCLPCHSGERPSSTLNDVTTWQGSYTSAPFDYVSNSLNAKHGDGQDCAVCHTGPGTGAWGSTQNWQGGHYAHQAGTSAANTCINCHTSQRPDLVLGVSQASTALGFDHSVNGTGDCFGCHQASVTAGSFAHYFNGSGMLPGGDWQGGQQYPGNVLVSSPTQFVSLTSYSLTRSGSLVTGITSSNVTLNNAMLHTSSQIPAALNPGPVGNPDYASCTKCHSPAGYADGQFHAALTDAGIPQTVLTSCGDCHEQMRPPGFVEKAASDLQAMDHRALLNGGSVSAVSGLDCTTCHKSPGTAWTDGKFHSNIGSATPADCTVCHYALMADAAKADLTQTTNYKMAHRSAQITAQKCDSCHASALSKATNTPLASTLFNPGAYHASVSAQPSLCIDCHLVSEPAANASTQSSVVYTLPQGGTATNGGQWMNHGSSFVAGKDCAVCHRTDAKTSGSAWAKSDLFHANVTGTITACQGCHGTGNGKGTVVGTNNNLPTGLTNSTMVTTAVTPSSTGVPAGTFDQLTHSDVNVTGHDCNYCHTQVGPSTASGVQGKEWAQAKFHTSFGSTALVMNLTTGRCANCHMNVRPGASFTAQDHSTFNNNSGSTDCSSCHSWPGTGTSSSPNWLGASGGAPTYITVGGFTVDPQVASNTTQAGIANLPHPTVGSTPCATCHTGGVGGRQAIGYDHASTLINTKCNSCHEAGSDLVGSPWVSSCTTQSGCTGDTRPYSIATLKCSKNNKNFSNNYKHFNRVDCKECHSKPSGIAVATTGSTYTSAWRFKHTESNMTNSSTCNLCHSSPNNFSK